MWVLNSCLGVGGRRWGKISAGDEAQHRKVSMVSHGCITNSNSLDDFCRSEVQEVLAAAPGLNQLREQDKHSW